jgi:hypothetical protein
MNIVLQIIKCVTVHRAFYDAWVCNMDVLQHMDFINIARIRNPDCPGTVGIHHHSFRKRLQVFTVNLRGAGSIKMYTDSVIAVYGHVCVFGLAVRMHMHKFGPACV